MKNQNDDQEWLDALAGKAKPKSDEETTQRAALLRQAIQRHDAALGVSDFDAEAGLQKLKFRMRREGLSGENKPTFFNNRFAQYAMAASIVLTVGLTMTLYLHEQPMQNEADMMRGGENRVILIDYKPDVRLKNLADGLAKIKAQYTFKELTENRFELTVKIDSKAQEYLQGQRIEATAVGSSMTIEIRPTKAFNKSN